MLSGRIVNETRHLMRKIVSTIEDVRSVLGAITEGKQPGPDKLSYTIIIIKNLSSLFHELYKSMIGSDELVRRLTQAYNGVMDGGVVPENI